MKFLLWSVLISIKVKNPSYQFLSDSSICIVCSRAQTPLLQQLGQRWKRSSRIWRTSWSRRRPRTWSFNNYSRPAKIFFRKRNLLMLNRWHRLAVNRQHMALENVLTNHLSTLCFLFFSCRNCRQWCVRKTWDSRSRFRNMKKSWWRSHCRLKMMENSWRWKHDPVYMPLCSVYLYVCKFECTYVYICNTVYISIHTWTCMCVHINEHM